MTSLLKVSSIPRPIVLLSLALNVIVIAVVGAHLWFHPGPPPDPTQLVARLADGLPEADGRILRLALKSEGLTPDHRSFEPEAVLDQARAAMHAEPFDPAVLAAVLHKGLSDRDAVDQAIVRAVVSSATAMSAEGRRRLAELRCHHLPPPSGS